MDSTYGKLMEDRSTQMLEYDYKVNLHQKHFKQSSLQKSERLGSWNSETHTFEFQPGKSLAWLPATTMYQVVTVIVSIVLGAHEIVSGAYGIALGSHTT